MAVFCCFFGLNKFSRPNGRLLPRACHTYLESYDTEEQEAGVACEGAGEDEGGEGDAVGDQIDWEVSSATWANTDKLSSRDFV